MLWHMGHISTMGLYRINALFPIILFQTFLSTAAICAESTGLSITLNQLSMKVLLAFHSV